MDRKLYRRLVAIAFHAISSGVLKSLSRVMDGSAATPSSSVPILSIAGTADPQCHPEAAARGASRTHVLGKEHGTEHDYGHFDLLMGRNVRREVWPLIGSWLDEH